MTRRAGPSSGRPFVRLEAMPRTTTPCSPRPASGRRAAALIALLVAGALAVAGCSGSTETTGEAESPAPSSKPKPPQLSPFTGQPTSDLPDHRAVMVKIENTSNGEPQLGVGSADLVVEELVEGGLTRLAAFYYSSLPKQVGPVRSVRGTDVGIAKPVKALLVASGGAPPTMSKLRQAHVPMATEGTPGFYRVGNRSAPYNLFAHLRKLPKSKLEGPKPVDYLPWGDAKELGRGKPAKRVQAVFSAAATTDWTWNGRYWKHGGGHTAKGDDFHPDNVLVLEVRQVDAGYRDPAGNPVPESILAGKGTATLFADGRAYEGAWTKKSNKAPLRLVDDKGNTMPVPPGHTWIELIPRAGGDLRFSG
jgi:Protein of unknown function (DUF3048) N-terminal domain/Protein of unknown function (DUF3048) C-terminal domain